MKSSNSGLPGFTLRDAFDRLEQIRVEIDAHRADVEKLRAEAGKILRDIETSGPFGPISSEAMGGPGTASIMSQVEFETLAKQILVKRGRPMKAEELRKEFAAIGRPITGREPAKNFNVKIHRAGRRFRKLNDGFWPAGVRRP